MKRLIFILIMTISSFMYSQDSTITYPHYLIENGKKTVVFTLEQAQKIDNNQQILAHFKALGIDIDAVDSACIKVVDTQGKEITGLKLEITKLKSLDADKDTEAANLKAQIVEYKVKDDLNKTELGAQKQTITEKDKQIRKQKRQ